MKNSDEEQIIQTQHNDSQVEITDLELPHDDGSKTSLLSASRFLLWQRTLNRRRARFATTLGILLLIALVVLLNIHTIMPFVTGLRNSVISNTVAQPLPINIKPSMVILPQHDGFVCLADTSWSLDSKYLALVGYQKNCTLENNIFETGQVDIDDALSGKVVASFRPDDAILSALHTQFPRVQGKPVIYYNHILWSPVGQGLALTFNIDLLFPPSPLQIASLNGVLLRDLHGMDEKVLLQIQPANPIYTEWDLERGEAVDASADTGIVSYSQTYRWGPNGSLIPGAQPLHSAATAGLAGDAIGNPDGNAAFTIWQPGEVELTTQVGQGPVHLPGVYGWNTFFAAWSPDGRYLIDNITIYSSLDIPGQPLPDYRTLYDLQMDHLPSFPVRDKGLQHVLETLSGAPGFLNRVSISWHPGGRTLAEYDAGTLDLDLYDSTTGFQTASLLLPTSTSIFGNTTMLHWSPNGSRLFLFDTQIGGVVIWNVQ